MIGRGRGRGGGLVGTPIIDLLSLLTIALLANGYLAMSRATAKYGPATDQPAPMSIEALEDEWRAVRSTLAPDLDAASSDDVDEVREFNSRLLGLIHTALEKLREKLASREELRRQIVRLTEDIRAAEAEGYDERIKSTTTMISDDSALLELLVTELGDLFRQLLGRDLEQRELPEPEFQEIVETVRDRLDASRAEVSRLAADVAKLLEELRSERAATADLRGKLDPLQGTDAEISRLEAEEKRLRSEIAQERRYATEDGRAPATYGTPIASSARVATSFYDLMLMDGEVWPITQPYFQTRFRYLGGTIVRVEEPVKDQRGLSIDESIGADSAVMKRVTTAAFRRSGRVRMLVRGEVDYQSFRRLRAAFNSHGVDFGWTPWPHDYVITATSAKGEARGVTIESQGRR